MTDRWIDLHTHTTASDGSMRPAELVRAAAAAGLSALAVTDHDTIDGLPEAQDAARAAGIEFVPGIEISVHWDDGTFHLLGYLFHDSGPLKRGIAELQALRRERNAKMIAKLNELGYGVSTAEVEAESGGGQVGRPHMAMALVKKGHVKSIAEAFQTLLKRGRPAYVLVDRLNPAVAIALIREAGGIAVLAHPWQLKLDDAALDRSVGEWRALGLGGIEVQHSTHDAVRQSAFEALAKRHGLAATGGSDFHGKAKPDVVLGHAFGGARVPASRLEALKKARDAQ